MGGSPDWLLGPLRAGGLGLSAGRWAGWSCFAALLVALGLYAVVLRRAAALSPRSLLGAVAALHALFLLAPPLLSQDVFSYLAYARMDVLEGLNPYETAPRDVPGDPVLAFAGSVDASSVYGPVFTLATGALAPLGLPAGLWALKAVAAAAALATVALVALGAHDRGLDPRWAVALVGLNPAWLVHVVGGAHNEALVVLVTTAGVVLAGASWRGARHVATRGRPAAGAALAAASVGLKASGALVVPFLVLGARRRAGAAFAALAALAVVLGVGLLAVAAFGPAALDPGAVLGANQGRSSSWSFPRKLAEGLALVAPGGWEAYLPATRTVLGAGALGCVAWLLLRTARVRIEPVRAAGWATLAVLVGTAWLVPWYVAWLLPLAALAGDRRLAWAAVALTLWTLPVAIPW